MKLLALAVCSVALTGCATKEYQAYVDAHKAQAAAQTARYQALADIARQGDTTAKVAAVMSLQMGSPQQSAQINAPKSWADYAMQWTGLLLPTIGQVYTVNKQVSLGMRQSDNATALGVSTNAAFVGIASQIQAPAANITTTTTTTDNSVRTDSTHTPTVVPTSTTTTSTSSSLTCTTGPC
jgi:hypothetical protein